MTTEDDLRASRARLVEWSNEARRTLERRMHEGVQQHLTAVTVKLRLLEEAIDRSPDAAKAELAELRAELQDAVEDLRDMAFGVYPALLTDRGIGEALAAAANRSSADVRVEVTAARRYGPVVESAVYFACTEVMLRAPSPSPVGIVVRETATGDALEVRFTGDVGARAARFVEDRVDAAGGNVRRERVDGCDVLVATLPVSADSAGSAAAG